MMVASKAAKMAAQLVGQKAGWLVETTAVRTAVLSVELRAER
jgi:hypothetical protein